MKRIKLLGKRFSRKHFLDQKLIQLKQLIKDDIEFGVPSYEDGSVSPRYTLEKMFSLVQEIDWLLNGKDIIQQPPATPEALEDFSEAFE
jgi:hypothetical protein